VAPAILPAEPRRDRRRHTAGLLGRECAHHVTIEAEWQRASTDSGSSLRQRGSDSQSDRAG